MTSKQEREERAISAKEQRRQRDEETRRYLESVRRECAAVHIDRDERLRRREMIQRRIGGSFNWAPLGGEDPPREPPRDFTGPDHGKTPF